MKTSNKFLIALMVSAVLGGSAVAPLSNAHAAIGSNGYWTSNPYHAHKVPTWKNRRLVRKQAREQMNHKVMRATRVYLSTTMKKAIHKHAKYFRKHWYRDGLSKRDYQARAWVVAHESSFRWNVLSYGHVCIGYFQLNPGYLGYVHRNGHRHVNLDHRHQVQVADAYAAVRYGNHNDKQGWVNAKMFWEAHNWY